MFINCSLPISVHPRVFSVISRIIDITPFNLVCFTFYFLLAGICFVVNLIWMRINISDIMFLSRTANIKITVWVQKLTPFVYSHYFSHSNPRYNLALLTDTPPLISVFSSSRKVGTGDHGIKVLIWPLGGTVSSGVAVLDLPVGSDVPKKTSLIN